METAGRGGMIKNITDTTQITAKISPCMVREPKESTGSSVRPYCNEQAASDASIDEDANIRARRIPSPSNPAIHWIAAVRVKM